MQFPGIDADDDVDDLCETGHAFLSLPLWTCGSVRFGVRQDFDGTRQLLLAAEDDGSWRVFNEVTHVTARRPG